MNIGYALSEIREKGRDPTWWRQRFLSRVVSPYYTSLNRPEATPLVDLDWDNVILLDACRFDLFKESLEKFDLPGKLSKRRSIQSATPGYVVENFRHRTFHDTIYVTANPYITTELSSDTFHAVDSVWRDGWDQDAGTVMPETLCERALAANERYPDKRLIVHFTQPHAPFVGEVSLGTRKVSAIREKALGREPPDRNERTSTPFELLERGEVTADQVWEAYRSNLLLALPSVERLMNTFSGKTAVTSDHGNALGEYAKPFPIRVYGHPKGILIPALIEVPWHTHENGDRKAVTAEPPVGDPMGESVDVEPRERLRDLGYVE